jgi:hypothetical protein
MAQLRYEVIRTTLSLADFRVTENTPYTRTNSSAPCSWTGLRNVLPTTATSNSSIGTKSPQMSQIGEDDFLLAS